MWSIRHMLAFLQLLMGSWAPASSCLKGKHVYLEGLKAFIQLPDISTAELRALSLALPQSALGTICIL